MSTPLTYDTATPEQRAFICNGCGQKGGKLRPPAWVFNEHCMRHDFAYWVGYTEKDRLAADKDFHAAMSHDARHTTPTPLKLWYKMMAWIYYRAVRHYGAPYFYYNAGPRDLYDLNNAMAVRCCAKCK